MKYNLKMQELIEICSCLPINKVIEEMLKILGSGLGECERADVLVDRLGKMKAKMGEGNNVGSKSQLANK